MSAGLKRVMAELCSLPPRHEQQALSTVARRLAREDPAALAALARDPSVGTLVRCLRFVPAGPHPMAERLAAVVARELGTRGVPVEPLVAAPAPSALDGYDIDDDTRLSLTDDNPLANVEAHPDKEGNAVSLGGRPAAEWIDSLRDALDRIERHLPELRAEMRILLRRLVPVGYDEQRHLSASYREAIGMAYLTLHPDPMTMTEALVHEFQHNKLNALFELDPVLDNAEDSLHASAIRPDPRPLRGILLAVHAFQPVSLLYRRMSERPGTESDAPLTVRPSFGRRQEEIRSNNREGAAVLKAHARPTVVGQGLMDEIARWDDAGL